MSANRCNQISLDASRFQGPGLERPEAAQQQEQPNEPSLWVRVWLEQILGYFWISIPVPKRYRIFETKTDTKSEINCEQDLWF